MSPTFLGPHASDSSPRLPSSGSIPMPGSHATFTPFVLFPSAGTGKGRPKRHKRNVRRPILPSLRSSDFCYLQNEKASFQTVSPFPHTHPHPHPHTHPDTRCKSRGSLRVGGCMLWKMTTINSLCGREMTVFSLYACQTHFATLFARVVRGGD